MQTRELTWSTWGRCYYDAEIGRWTTDLLPEILSILTWIKFLEAGHLWRERLKKQDTQEIVYGLRFREEMAA